MKTFAYLTCLTCSFLAISQIWEHTIQDIDTTSTIRLEGEKWNNTLIKNCVVHNTGNGKDGILLKNVSNVRIENCTVYDINGQGGIRLSMSDGGTKNVEIINNTVYNIQGNGIDTPQRSQSTPPANQENLKIIGNTIYNTGLRRNTGHDHAIYCQAADVLIKNNLIYGVRDGNGISVRSSGTVSGNRISGKSKANKSAIRYFSDHYTGKSKTLIIENNMINNDSTDAHTFELINFGKLYKNHSGEDHIVKNFNIRFNTIISFKEKKYPIRISDDFAKTGYSVKTEGNLLINTSGSEKFIQVPENSTQLYNQKLGKVSDFVSNKFPYDYHLKSTSPAINFVGNKSTNFPPLDIDGNARDKNALDAGADQYVSGSSPNSPLNVLRKNSNLQVFPNPTNSENINISSKEIISEIVIYNEFGHKVFNQKFRPTSKNRNIQIPTPSGLYFVVINKKYTSTMIRR